MGLEVKGRVEIRHVANPDWWRGAIDLSGFDLRDSRIFDYLFWPEPNEDVSFTLRGMPGNRSYHTLRDWGKWRMVDKHAASWVMWDELKPALSKILENGTFAGEWDVLYNLCKVLVKAYAPDRVRIVWWLH